MLYALLAFVVLLIVLAFMHVLSEIVAAILFLFVSCGVVYFAWISPNLRRPPKGH